MWSEFICGNQHQKIHHEGTKGTKKCRKKFGISNNSVEWAFHTKLMPQFGDVQMSRRGTSPKSQAQQSRPGPSPQPAQPQQFV
jgi:hypothetical protein